MADEWRYLEDILLALRENNNSVVLEAINACHESVHLLLSKRGSKLVRDLVLQLLLIANAEPRKYICEEIIEILVALPSCFCEEHCEQLSKLMLRSGLSNSVTLARFTKRLLQSEIQAPQQVQSILRSSYLNIIYGSITPSVIKEYLNLFQVHGAVGLRELKSTIREEHLFCGIVMLHRSKSVRESFEPKNCLNAQILTRRWSQMNFCKESIFHFRNESLELLKLNEDVSHLWRNKCIRLMQSSSPNGGKCLIFSNSERVSPAEENCLSLIKFCIYD
ncbi:hypothetical protein Ciccas_004450 [Cichlidogyrus casuarinus]|uniref:Uncharacterized protein n=1 Tax=Cichlidogyrus casuarinus TaxID=1844966 RepID=A0ABD2QCA7_9PLAT